MTFAARLLAVLALTLSCPAIPVAAPPPAVPLAIEDGVRDKNFFVLRAFESPPARSILQAEPTLARLANDHRTRIAAALDSCASNAECYVNAARLTDAELARMESALRDFCTRRSSDCHAIATSVRQGGAMIREQNSADAELLASSWRLTATAIGHIFATYGEGAEPRYPKIDAMSHDPKSEDFGNLLRTATRVVLTTDVKENLFYSDYVRFALLLLAADGRNEAGRHEPLDQGENRAAFEQMKQTAWHEYRYALILVPGQGPEEPAVRLAPEGRLRLELAVTRFRQRVAPYICVSGGYVHPARTPFSEAVEMKRALVEEYGVPANAVLIDPHARHTTTNLRNAARMMYRYGMPFTMPGLVVTDERQADYIMRDAFEERNRRETGIVPYRGKKRISATEVEFVPSTDALQVGFEDPLDP